MKKCVYCGKEVNEDIAIDVCHDCGDKVWGRKMFQAIIDNMGNAKAKGDLFQGSVSDSENLQA